MLARFACYRARRRHRSCSFRARSGPSGQGLYFDSESCLCCGAGTWRSPWDRHELLGFRCRFLHAEATTPDLRRGAHEEVKKELAEFAEVCLLWTS